MGPFQSEFKRTDNPFAVDRSDLGFNTNIKQNLGRKKTNNIFLCTFNIRLQILSLVAGRFPLIIAILYCEFYGWYAIALIGEWEGGGGYSVINLVCAFR